VGPHPSLPAGNNGQEQPLDPRYAQQQHPAQQPDGNWQQQAQHAQVSDGTYPSQDHQAQQQQPGYHYPQAQETQPFQQNDPRYANPGGPAASGGQPTQGDPNQYAPQFTPYAPQTADPYQAQQGQAGVPHYDETPVTGAQQDYQGYPAGTVQAPQTMENPAYPQAQQGSFNQQQEEWLQTPQPGPAPDAHGYDAGGYAGAQQSAPGAPDYLTHPEYAAQADPYAAQQATPFTGDPALQAGITDPAGHGEFDYGYEEDGYADEYETKSSGGGTSRMLLIVGALVGAIVVGGGLAYGWKMISGPGGGKNSETPIVHSGTSPNKIRPDNPGGRQFDHTDSKILGRLGGTSASASRSDSSGTKKVQTLSISRRGQVSTPTATASPGGQSEVSVPGLTVVDAFGAASGQPLPTAHSVTVRQPIVVKPPDTRAPTGTKPRVQVRTIQKKPIVITKRTTPTTRAVAPKTTAPVKPKPRVTAKKPVVPARTASVRKKPQVSTRTAPKSVTSGSKGFVAVLASMPLSSSSRMNALMKYADLQQKYSTLLANKTPDVREANLGIRGKYHRLLVGPPGSRAQASSLCSKLKSAGYSGCWVTSY